ncbi:MAG: hypothetical protein GX297_01895 [Treponema sp.]|jgi:hypothetical protein|nr:hypothetical protein [Treponema sp.]
MNDWGLYLLAIFCLMIALNLSANYIIDPYVKKSKGLEYKFSKPKIILTLFFNLYMLSFALLVFGGFFD